MNDAESGSTQSSKNKTKDITKKRTRKGYKI